MIEFTKEVIDELVQDFMKIKVSDNYLTESEAQEKLGNLLIWLNTTPKNIVFRVNTLLCDQQVAYNSIINSLKQYSKPLPNILTYPSIMELIIVKSWDSKNEITLTKPISEIIVDAACGSAVLRGSHVFAPGILGMPYGLNIGDAVSVYADLKQACKRGLTKPYDEEKKLYIGYGIVKMTRNDIFNQKTKNISGIAVLMNEVISCIPQINDNILPKGQILLQNLPSILCSRVLDPQPGEIILDMCAAPGNKTTHIASLMQNKGTVIAIEKIKSKLEKLNRNIQDFSASIVKVFCYDSIKAVCDIKNVSVLNGPPFSIESFDRILLDGPCSAIGRRPQLRNPINISQLRSYVPLQRKLFTSAVKLLKPGGTLVYSTCSITVAENESIIAWAIKTYPNLDLLSIQDKLTNLEMDKFAGPGYNIDGLTLEQSEKLCRFDRGDDTVGFFMALFKKR